MSSSEKISQILKRVINKSHAGKMDEASIKMGWDGFVGQEVAKHTAPAFLKKGILFVNVDSSAWAYELSTHLKNILLGKINEGVGQEVVKDIHFKVRDLAGQK